MMIPIVIGALGTISKGLLKGVEDLEIRGQQETIKITALLRSTRILSRVLESWGDLLSLNLQWKTIRWGWWEKLSRSNIIMHKGLHLRNYIDSMHLGKKEENDSPTLRIASMQQLKCREYNTKSKQRLITAASNKNGNIR